MLDDNRLQDKNRLQVVVSNMTKFILLDDNRLQIVVPNVNA